MTDEELQAIAQYLMSQGVDPTAWLVNQGDLGDTKDFIDILNSGLLVADKERDAMADLFGPRALLGEGVYNPAAFTPIRETMPMPYAQRVARYRADPNAPTMSVDDFVAMAIAKGGNAGNAVTVMQNLINSDPSLLSPDETAVRNSLIASLPPIFDTATGEYRAGTPDLRALAEQAQAFGTSYMEEAAAAEGYTIDPVSGMAYKETPSPAAQEYYDRGMYLPTDRYSTEGFMTQVQPDWVDPYARLEELLGTARGRRADMMPGIQARGASVREADFPSSRGPMPRQAPTPAGPGAAAAPDAAAMLNSATSARPMERRDILPGPIDEWIGGLFAPEVKSEARDGGPNAAQPMQRFDPLPGPIDEWLGGLFTPRIKSEARDIPLTPEQQASQDEAIRRSQPGQLQKDWWDASEAYRKEREATLTPTFWRNSAMSFLLNRHGRNPHMDQIAGLQGFDLGMPEITDADRTAWYEEVVNKYTKDRERLESAVRGNQKVSDTAYGRDVLAKLASNPQRNRRG